MKLGELKQGKPFRFDPVGVYTGQFILELLPSKEEADKIIISKPKLWTKILSYLGIGLHQCLGCKSPLSIVEIPESSLGEVVGNARVHSIERCKGCFECKKLFFTLLD